VLALDSAEVKAGKCDKAQSGTQEKTSKHSTAKFMEECTFWHMPNISNNKVK